MARQTSSVGFNRATYNGRESIEAETNLGICEDPLCPPRSMQNSMREDAPVRDVDPLVVLGLVVAQSCLLAFVLLG